MLKGNCLFVDKLSKVLNISKYNYFDIKFVTQVLNYK